MLSALHPISLRWITLLLISLLISITAHSQTAEFTQGSPSSNTMTLQVPLGSYPGRGMSLPINLNYSSKVWRLGFIGRIYYTSGGSNQLAEAIYSEYQTAGWTTSLDVPLVEWPKLNDVYWYSGKPRPLGSFYPYTFRVARVFIHMPDGSTHELRKADQVYQDYGSIDTAGTFYAVDGTRMRYDSSNATTGTLYLADGTRYIINSSAVQCIDRNGNTLSYDRGARQWTDTMGRVIGMPWPANPQAGIDYAYALPAVGGGTTTYTLKFKSLANTLSPNTPALKPVGDYYLPYPDQSPTNYNGGNFTQATQGASMFVSGLSDPEESDYQTNTRVIGRGQVGSNAFNPVVLAEIALPNGLSYKFSYNNYGELDKVSYPSKAYQRYEYGVVPGLTQQTVPYPQVNRGLTSRWLSADGLESNELRWTYEFGGPGYSITLTAPDGMRTVTTMHSGGSTQNNFGYDSALIGLPYEQRILAPSGQSWALVRRTLTSWATSDATYNRPPQGIGTYTATRNPRPTKTVNLILDTGGDALTSTTTYSYDDVTYPYHFSVGLERTGTSEYGFTTVDQYTAQNSGITAMPLGAKVRGSNTSYLTSDNNYRSRNLLGLATYASVNDANDNPVARSSVFYDEAAFPLLASGSVASWTDPQTAYRGNPTTNNRWLDYPTSSWLQSYTQYDQYGNVRNVWDAKDTLLAHPSQVSYSAASFYAYPTTTTSAAPDPNSNYGQPTGFVSSAVYDFQTGLITSTTDANGNTTAFEYNDPLNRPTKVTRPDGGWTATNYNDDPDNTYVRVQTLQQATPSQQVLESYQFYDKLRRSVRSAANEGSTYLSSDTQYDNFGRLVRASNPYRTSYLPALNYGAPGSAQWTTNTYDALSRVISVTTPDSAHADTAYGYSLTSGYLGATVTASDQTGKARKSITDSAGRLTRVIEDPNGAALQTNYTYDVLNNLRQVEQGSQLRYFGYDSLSRLIRVRHVEQTINASLPAWTDPVTSYSGGWTAAFSYDANGNLTSRTDARNITTSFTYDQLNRVTTVRYANDPENTPGLDSYYDGYRNQVFTNIANVQGHAWQNETPAQVKFTVDNFDVLGRPTIQRQQFWTGAAWGNSYQVSVGYNLAGAITSETYPSNRQVTYKMDPAGRLELFSGNLGDGGAARTYANNFEYNEFGAVQQEQFGTDAPVFHKQRFNVRGQLWDVRASTVSFAADAGNGDRGAIVNYYSANYTQGGSGADNNGSVRRQETYLPGGPYFQQTYGYDQLNRLTSVAEKQNGAGADSFKQVYDYDRWGNRTVNQGQTTSNVTRPSYTVDVNTNRLVAPAGYSYGYDNAGNQTNDTYTGGGQRTYDAQNHLVSAQAGGAWQNYKYSGSGLRVRRIVNNVESWQIYGLGGELVAEYAANAAVTAPQQEYGYRGGQLLLTAEAGVGRNNVALAGSGATATAQNYTADSTFPGYHWQPSFAIDGQRYCHLIQSGSDGTGFWRDEHGLPSWLQVDFPGAKMIDEIDVFTVRDFPALLTQADPTGTETFTQGGTSAFTVQYWTGSAWAAVTGGTISGNNLVWKKVSFAAVTTSKIRVVANAASDSVARIVEVEAWTASGPNLNWVVTDQLGTPRLIFDKTGSLAATKRHDYLPFGEELGGAQVALLGGRTTAQGYTSDSTRQHFTGYELDAETGLNFAQARYQSSVQGRFTSVDPLGASAKIGDPQSFNRYSYVNNNPINLTDPSGMMTPNPATGMVQTDDESYARTLQGNSDAEFQHIVNDQSAAQRGLTLNQAPVEGNTRGDWRNRNTGSPDPVAGDPSGQTADASPARIDSEPNSACNISVFFTGESGIQGMTNGVNYFLSNPGLGLTVEVSVPSGGIAEVGGVQYKRKGWRLEQLINFYGWNARNGGAPEKLDTPTRSDRIDPLSIRINGNSAKWIDHFGPNLFNRAHQRLTGHGGQWNIIFKAMNRGKGCSLEFHAVTKMGSDGIFHASWDKGLQ